MSFWCILTMVVVADDLDLSHFQYYEEDSMQKGGMTTDGEEWADWELIT